MGVFTLQQLGGDRLKLELADHAAPHGRPRDKPVFEQEDVFRIESTYYPGTPTPTRHEFGLKFEPIKLDGRFRDALGGKGFARNKMDEVRRFAAGLQLCTLTWDDALSVICIITRVKRGVESKGEIVWEIEIEIDEDLFLGRGNPITPEVKGPDELAKRIQSLLSRTKDLPYTPPTIKGSIGDQLMLLAGAVGNATSQLVDASRQIDSFVNAPFQALTRFRAALGLVRVSVSNLRGTYDHLTTEAALQAQETEDAQEFWNVQAAWSESSLKALQEAARAERAAARVQQGRILLFYAAADGDTWESIAIAAYGAPDRAREIQAANGVPVGQNPVPGTIYMVPR